jgi:hypothetical protein
MYLFYIYTHLLCVYIYTCLIYIYIYLAEHKLIILTEIIVILFELGRIKSQKVSL